MPLVARNAKTGERIDITRHVDPRSDLRAEEVVCPECAWPMIVRHGMLKVAHFAHRPGANCAYGAGETIYHLMGKQFVAEWLRENSGLEVPVEFEWKIANRRADVAQIFPTGWTVAYEIQLASITPADLQARSDDYLAAGCDVIWLLGKAALTVPNRKWAEQFQGFVPTLIFHELKD
jgi:competence protein CoiA